MAYLFAPEIKWNLAAVHNPFVKPKLPSTEAKFRSTLLLDLADEHERMLVSMHFPQYDLVQELVSETWNLGVGHHLKSVFDQYKIQFAQFSPDIACNAFLQLAALVSRQYQIPDDPQDAVRIAHAYLADFETIAQLLCQLALAPGHLNSNAARVCIQSIRLKLLGTTLFTQELEDRWAIDREQESSKLSDSEAAQLNPQAHEICRILDTTAWRIIDATGTLIDFRTKATSFDISTNDPTVKALLKHLRDEGYYEQEKLEDYYNSLNERLSQKAREIEDEQRSAGAGRKKIERLRAEESAIRTQLNEMRLAEETLKLPENKKLFPKYRRGTPLSKRAIKQPPSYLTTQRNATYFTRAVPSENFMINSYLARNISSRQTDNIHTLLQRMEANEGGMRGTSGDLLAYTEQKYNMVENWPSDIPLIQVVPSVTTDIINIKPTPIKVYDHRRGDKEIALLPPTHYICRIFEYIRYCLMQPSAAAKYVIILRAQEGNKWGEDDPSWLADPPPTSEEVDSVIAWLAKAFPNIHIRDIGANEVTEYTFAQFSFNPDTTSPEIEIHPRFFDLFEIGIMKNLPTSTILYFLFMTVAHEFAHFLGQAIESDYFDKQPEYLTPWNLHYFTEVRQQWGGEMGHIVEFMLFGGVAAWWPTEEFFDYDTVPNFYKGVAFYTYGSYPGAFVDGKWDGYSTLNFAFIEPALTDLLWKSTPVLRLNKGLLQDLTRELEFEEPSTVLIRHFQPRSDRITIKAFQPPQTRREEIDDVDAILAGRAIKNKRDRNMVRNLRPRGIRKKKYRTITSILPCGPRREPPRTPKWYPEAWAWRHIVWLIICQWALIFINIGARPDVFVDLYPPNSLNEQQPEPNLWLPLLTWSFWALYASFFLFCPLRIPWLLVFGLQTEN